MTRALRTVSVFALLITSIGLAMPQEPKATDSPGNLVAAAIRFYDLKQYDMAIETASSAVKLLPKDHRPWAIIGNSYLAQWKMKSASEAYAKAAEINPKLKGLWYMKAYADRMRNAAEDSIAAANKAIELDPKYAEAYEIMGEAKAMGSRDRDGAVQAFRRALKIKPDYAKASQQLGMLLDDKEAEEVYRRAMELDPKKMACRFSLGRILVKQGRLTAARELWNGRSSDETNTFPLFITLLERAERKKAAADKLAESPNDPVALTDMGFAEMEGEPWVVDGRQQRAIAFFKKALAIDAGNAKAQFGIGKALVEMSAMDKKLTSKVDEELEKLRTMDPKLADELIEYRNHYSGGLRTDKFTTIDQ